MLLDYQLLDEDCNGSQLIKLTCSEFSGIIYSYGGVNFVEEGDTLRMQFSYDLHECDQELDVEKFKNHIGDILIELLDRQLIKNEVVYTGGVDENRTTDFDQSDS